MIKLFSFEVDTTPQKNTDALLPDDNAINDKYEKGEVRIVTEQGAFKLPFLCVFFSKDNYILQPQYQRRITWDNMKRSKLIESFIMNVPVPPVFLYEEDYNFYEVMDGLQRITALIDFYKDDYALEGLLEWPELNGRKYSNLPMKIKEGIDRRQLSYVVLLKESTDSTQASKTMKKIVFERLNTGGVKLTDQEIRNALLGGPFNDLCIMLSRHPVFCELWGITPLAIQEKLGSGDNNLFSRMDDVELVLRYFTMRHIYELKSTLSISLDDTLSRYNKCAPFELDQLSTAFVTMLYHAKRLFGDKAFCQYKRDKRSGEWKWSKSQRFIFDAMTIALSQDFDYSAITSDVKTNLQALEKLYRTSQDSFEGKKTGKGDIISRFDLFTVLLEGLSGN